MAGKWSCLEQHTWSQPVIVQTPEMIWKEGFETFGWDSGYFESHWAQSGNYLTSYVYVCTACGATKKLKKPMSK
jgi:hypothetical protein